jgi:S1-C subfamily serine protease
VNPSVVINSGGPMFNMTGEVIGIASHNISKSGGSEGLGFVVTINMARRLLLEQRSFWSGMSGVINGDIILAVQGREIGSETYEALQAHLRSLPSGSIITVVVLRDGRPVTLQGAKD